MLRGVFALALMLVATESLAIEICSGGNRAARKVTCLVDGDTGWERGIKWRMLNIDTPETFGAECSAEKSIGNRATARLQELMTTGYQLHRTGRKDRTSDRRDLVHVMLADGRDAGQVLIAEGLAQPWPNRGNRWCGH
ncbi:MAG: thermonuclease family protein [Allorhizobium sp.]